MPKTAAFNKLKLRLSESYPNERVPAKYQSRYGKRYASQDINSFAYAVAKSRGIRIDR